MVEYLKRDIEYALTCLKWPQVLVSISRVLERANVRAYLDFLFGSGFSSQLAYDRRLILVPACFRKLASGAWDCRGEYPLCFRLKRVPAVPGFIARVVESSRP